MIFLILISYLQEVSVSGRPSQSKRRKRADGSLKRGVARIVGGKTEEEIEVVYFHLKKITQHNNHEHHPCMCNARQEKQLFFMGRKSLSERA